MRFFALEGGRVVVLDRLPDLREEALHALRQRIGLVHAT